MPTARAAPTARDALPTREWMQPPGQSVPSRLAPLQAAGVLVRRLLRPGPARETLARLQQEIDDLAAQNRELRGLCITDPLTCLLNRRGFYEALARDMSRAQRHSEELAVVLFDLDRFKSVNDSFGHAAGDAALRVFSGILSSNLRGSDSASRYGGDEFGVVLTRVSTKEPTAFAERVRVALEGSWIRVANEELRMTVSAGAAKLSECAARGKGVLSLADARLYQAKHAGGDCVRGGDP